MHGGADRAYTLLTRREQAVVEALLADQSPEEIAARFRTSVRSIKADVIAIYRKQRLRAVQASMAEYRDRQIEWLDENRLLTMRRMLGSADAAGLHLHLLAALRAWTGAGQAAFWEIREGSGGLRVRSAAGIEYPVRGDGIVPTLAVRPVAIIRSALLANEEWAPVAGSEAASAVDGELLALRLTHGGKCWMALLADLPEGKVHHAAAASAEALVGMASLVAASFPEALPRAACGAVDRGDYRTPGPRRGQIPNRSLIFPAHAASIRCLLAAAAEGLLDRIRQGAAANRRLRLRFRALLLSWRKELVAGQRRVRLQRRVQVWIKRHGFTRQPMGTVQPASQPAANRRTRRSTNGPIPRLPVPWWTRLTGDRGASWQRLWPRSGRSPSNESPQPPRPKAVAISTDPPRPSARGGESRAEESVPQPGSCKDRCPAPSVGS